MKHIFSSSLIFLTALAQISLLPYLSSYGISVNLIFLIMVSLIFSNRDESLLWLIIGGLLLDIYSPVTFGVYIIMLSIIYLTAIIISRYFFSQINFLPVFTFLIISSAFLNCAWFFTIPESASYYLVIIKLIFTNSLFAGILGTFIYYLVNAPRLHQKQKGIFLKNEAQRI